MPQIIPRTAIATLQNWKESTNRKPLLIRGARQVGKSTLVRDFARQFGVFLELNLEFESDRKLFEIERVDDLVQAAALEKGIRIKPHDTLIFIDEIQESPKAIQQLRYFYEQRKDLYVIAAGSLLEFALSAVPSFPVGRVDYLYLYPLNFREYLLATHQDQLLKVLLQSPVPSYAHQALLNEFHRYAIIGGMPEIVAEYAASSDLSRLPSFYKKLWQAYQDDSEKYARNETERRVIRHVIQTAPHEKDRIAFEGFGQSNFRSREIGDALRTLDLAGIIRLVYPTTEVVPPATLNFRKRPRLQFLDTGLINHALSLQSQMIGLKDLSDFQRGKTIQQLVSQELTSVHLNEPFQAPFWVRESSAANAEVDLIHQIRQHLIPIEIKAGKSGTLRSLHEFIDRCPHGYAVRMYAGPYSIEDHTTPSGKPFQLMNLPYYLATELENYLAGWVD